LEKYLKINEALQKIQGLTTNLFLRGCLAGQDPRRKPSELDELMSKEAYERHGRSIVE
jgi:hypothetical protein